MIYSKYETPWNHLIIDNLLGGEDFNRVKDYITTKYDLKTLTRPSMEVHSINSPSFLFPLLSPIILELKEKYFDFLNYGNKTIPDILYPYVEVRIIPPGFDYRIHPDAEYKVMTTVLYVAPEDANGTEVYTSYDKKSFVGEIEWKQNRGLCFVSQSNPKFQETLHGYKNTRNEARATINLNLCTTPYGQY